MIRFPLRLLARLWLGLVRAPGGRPEGRPGVHAIAVTPDGRIVLVRLRYARGWRLPGGGRRPGEDPAEAALRELREEIGLVAHGPVEPVGPPGADGAPELFIVRGVAYRPRWSLEVEAVIETAPDDLPGDLAAPARAWLAQAGEQIRRREQRRG